MKLHAADIAVLAVYFCATIGMGLWFSRRNNSSEHYFLGGRNFPGWAIGISFIGATISSITFIAYPADSFKTAWVRFLPNLAFPLIATLAGVLFIPFFRQGGVRSAYHYLALRFGPSVSVYAACVYLLAQIVRTATITYLLAVLLSTLTGLPTPACIVMAGSFTAFYTVKGGFAAVVWTDVIQTTVLILGALCCVSVIWSAIPGGFAQIISEATAAGKLSFRDLNIVTGQLEPVRGGFSFSEKTTLMLVLVGASQYIAGQLDQDSVQRWCSARSLREARKSMVVLGLGAVPIWAGFMFLGTCLWVFFQRYPTDVSRGVLEGVRKAEDILPHFIVTVLPPGLAGLVIAAAAAAAMGSLSSCINAAAMVWVNDLQRPYFTRRLDEGGALRSGRLASLIMAVLMMGGAFWFYHSNAKTLMEIAIIMTQLFGGGIAGAFLFGILTRSGDGGSVMAGILVTILFTLYATLVQFGALPRVFNPYYTAILSNLVMFGTCWLSSRLIPAKPRDLTALTLWDRPSAVSQT